MLSLQTSKPNYTTHPISLAPFTIPIPIPGILSILTANHHAHTTNHLITATALRTPLNHIGIRTAAEPALSLLLR